MPDEGTEPHGEAGLRVSAPAKRRAFLGRFAPSFRDVANPHKVEGQSTPNAVLENAIGLMLCYDELWFLRRSDCPADMQNLDFVRFVSDEAALQSTATEAFHEGRRLLMQHAYDEVLTGLKQLRWPIPYPEAGSFVQRRAYVERAMDRAGFQAALREPWSYEEEYKNRAGRRFIEVLAALDINQMAEWIVADALQLGPMDFIVNSDATFHWSWPNNSPDVPEESRQFEAYKIEAVEQVLHLRSVDALTPAGAYQDYIADLRKDRRIKELRAFLAGQPSPDGTALALAEEVGDLVASYHEEAFRRVHRPATLRTLGSMALGMAGNQLLPGLGGVLGTLVNADRLISDYQFRKNSKWAMFVLDARGKAQAPPQPTRRESRE
jgi:hypothetical protein